MGRQRQSNFDGQTSVSRLLVHGRAAALELGTKEVFVTAEDFVNATGKGGRPLVIEATNIPLEFRDAVRASRIGVRVLAGIPDGDATHSRPRRRAGAA